MEEKRFIYFHKHAIDRYAQRLNHIYGNNISENGDWVNLPKLENEIMRKGVFYQDPKHGPGSFYCVVNNLTVYKGDIMPDGTLKIVTTYPYKKELRSLLVKLERIHIPQIEQFRQDLEARIRGAAAAA